MQATIQPYGDNFIFVIPVEDEILHTPDKPFCWDNTCPCHEDALLIAEVAAFVLQGIMTLDEATHFISGRTV